METSLGPLLPLYERERSAQRALALGLLVHTAGSTYRKPGALILIDADGNYAGLLSGGCLEGDLREHARRVIETGKPHRVRYDLSGPDDLLWGLGSGCEGAMQILLLYAGPANGWEPLARLSSALAAHQPLAFGVVTETSRREVSVGDLVFAGEPRWDAALREALHTAQCLEATVQGVTLLVLPLALPPRVLLLGGGPDAVPVVRLASILHWKVTIADHRPAYARRERFPEAEQVLQCDAQEVGTRLELDRFDAAVVMSHHLASDQAYLRALARTRIPFLGLLGPAARRERLLAALDPAAIRGLTARLHAPVGLLLGGRTPESIALAIVSELHAFVHGAGAARSTARAQAV